MTMGSADGWAGEGGAPAASGAADAGLGDAGAGGEGPGDEVTGDGVEADGVVEADTGAGHAFGKAARGFGVTSARHDERGANSADAIALLHQAFLGHRDRKMARAELDQMCCVGTTGVFNMNPDDHSGLVDSVLTLAVSRSATWIRST